jgi:hypothetical protein
MNITAHLRRTASERFHWVAQHYELRVLTATAGSWLAWLAELAYADSLEMQSLSPQPVGIHFLPYLT